LVSPGFSQIYDELLDSNKLTYFTNGVDEHFVKFYYSLKDKQVSQDPPFIIKNRTILYAGNLGLGQDIIELFKPLVYQDIAQQLTDLGWSIRIIGDGVQAPDLKQLASQPHLRKLITVLNPIPRYELIEEYQKADALFLQVGNYRSLDMVIPSKIFEYAATRLPILAGVRGYTRDFIDQIPGVQFFTQKNITSFLRQIKEIKTFSHNRDQFIEQYDRTKIMVKYADHLLDQLQTKDVSLSFPIAEKSRTKITASNL
jgi:glycosyltransferase involved in cell wall biosynthesis